MNNCHIEYHQNQVLFGNFGIENCEQKPFINNYQGECENPSVHPKKETIEFFCKDCNKGICSFCRFNSNEKHKDLNVITTLFSSCSLNDRNTSYKEIKDEFIPKTRELTSIVSNIQKSNKTTANKLREVILKGFQKMFSESNDSFNKEGENLLGMCYQLNYLKDCMYNFHKLYDERETLLKSTN